MREGAGETREREGRKERERERERGSILRPSRIASADYFKRRQKLFFLFDPVCPSFFSSPFRIKAFEFFARTNSALDDTHEIERERKKVDVFSCSSSLELTSQTSDANEI